MSNCELCGEPMPKGEEMFKYHGYSGNCPKPPIQQNHKDCDDTCQAKIIEQALASPDQPPASRQGADELDAILVLFSKRLAIVQGEYNASTKLSEVQKHAEEAQDEAKAAIAALIEKGKTI